MNNNKNWFGEHKIFLNERLVEHFELLSGFKFFLHFSRTSFLIPWIRIRIHKTIDYGSNPAAHNPVHNLYQLKTWLLQDYGFWFIV
jgi:hypothetical protein